MNDASPATTLDTHRLRIIAFFILAFAAGGVVQPFLNLYLVEVGFSGAQVGVLLGYTSFAIVIVTPLLGWLADRTQRHRLLLGIIVAIKGLSVPAMLLSTGWVWLALTVSVRMMTAGAQDALMNRLTMAHLKERGQTNFGSIRLWGALSFAATSLLAGWLARDQSVSVLFPLSGILGLLAALCVTGFPTRIAARSESAAPQPALRRSSALLTLFMLIFFLTLGRSGYETFSNIYISTTLGASNTWIGLLGAIASLTPVFAFALADTILCRFGKINTLLLGSALSALAFLLLAFAPSPLWTVPAVICNGAAGAFYLVGLVNLLSQLGNPAQAATDQMLAQLTLPGLAGMVAQPVSGWVFDAYGGQTMLILGAAITALCVLFVVFKHDVIAP